MSDPYLHAELRIADSEFVYDGRASEFGRWLVDFLELAGDELVKTNEVYLAHFRLGAKVGTIRTPSFPSVGRGS